MKILERVRILAARWWRGPVLLVCCAWCKADLGTKSCEPEMDGQVSHGICPGCAASLRAARRAA